MAEKQEGTFKGNVKSEYNFTWEIVNFSENFDRLESETFLIYPLCNSSWKVFVDICPLTQMLRLGMRREDENSHSVVVNSEFSLRNSNGTLFAIRYLSKTFSSGHESLYCDKLFNKPTNANGVKNDLGSQFRLCSNDVLVIEGKVSITPCCSQHNVTREQNADQLIGALKTSLNENIFTDVEIDVGGELVSAHKFMLAARSSVFKRMLETKMKEKTDNKIEITDVDKSVFDTFLAFLYTGFIKDYNFQVLIQLYALADKYDVQSLFQSCSSALSTNMSETTVCDILSLADLHNDKSLTEKTFDYLCENFNDVKPTEEWKRFVNENTSLAAEVVHKVVANIGVKDKW